MNMQNSVSYAFECELTMKFVTKGGRKFSHLIRSLFLKYKYFFAFFTFSLSRKTITCFWLSMFSICLFPITLILWLIWFKLAQILCSVTLYFSLAIISFPLLRLDNSGNGCRWMSSTTFDVELKGSHFSFVYLKSLNRQFVKRILTLQAKGIKFVYSLIVTSLFTFQMKSDRIKPINVGERCCCERFLGQDTQVLS